MRNLITISTLFILLSCKKDNTSTVVANLPTVTTKAGPTVYQTSALSGGSISNDGGATIIARGVCWSTSPNPEINDNHTSDGSGVGSFNSTITGLIAGTNYYVRAYGTNNIGTSYGNEVSFSTATTPPIIYIAGMVSNVAAIWKSGVLTSLTPGQATGACSVFVTGNDVYIGGIHDQNGVLRDRAAYWKNGIETILTDGLEQAAGFSIFISNNDVYVAGFEKNSNNISVAKYWKNGIAIPLTDGTHEARAEAICVNGNDVYVAGYEENTSTTDNFIKVWKNGVPTILGNTVDDGAGFYGGHYGIAVSGSDVYVATSVRQGSSNPKATIWKNGVPTVLSPTANGSACKSVFISGSDVYVAGYTLDASFYNVATIWKNGVPTFLPRPSGALCYAESVYVLGSDVYAAGWQLDNIYSRIMLWKNGIAYPWSDGATVSANGASIFVKYN